MLKNQFELLHSKRFYPFFITQFLSILNSHLFKNALVIVITFRLADSLTIRPSMLITLAAALYILPVFLFSALAGQIADKYDKAFLIKRLKLAEVGIMLLAGVAFYAHNVGFLMGILVLLGIQNAFFAPLRYAILPDQLKSNELIAANGFIEGSIFLAALLGTLIINAFTSLKIGTSLIAISCFLIAVLGYLASLKIIKSNVCDPSLKLNYNFIDESLNLINNAFKKPDLYLAILGISWFWLMGATYLTEFPTYVKVVLKADASVVTVILGVFTAGIMLGSLFCHGLLKGRIHATHVPLAAIGMTIFASDIVIASQNPNSNPVELLSLFQFLHQTAHWRIILDLFLLGVCSGIYIVPLYTLLQFESSTHTRAQTIAANNLVNAIFIITGAIATNIMLMVQLSITSIFMIIAIANLFAAIFICNILPEELLRSFMIWVFKTLYRVEVQGIENYHEAGNRVLIVANHTSFLDGALLTAFLPNRLTFAINTEVAQRWWIKLILKFVNTHSVDPTNPLAAKSLIEHLEKDHQIVIFPEGRISVTGALMKIYEGPGLIADKANAMILPIRINGAQYTPFSYLRGKVKIHWFPKITLTILKPRSIDLPTTITGRERRQLISAKLYDLMSDTIFLSSNISETLYSSLIDAASIHGRKTLILEDIERKPLSYKKLILGSIVLGRKIAKQTKFGECVGLLLPNSNANVVTFFGLQAHHRIPAMLNFTAGAHNLISACKTAEIRYIYSSRRFIEVAELHHEVSQLTAEGFTIIYLEDIRESINILQKLTGKFFSWFPYLYYKLTNHIKKGDYETLANKPAVVLFTSGSEGAPKGVVLSHQNLQANRYQIIARVDFNPSDILFNALPMFHSFGLTSGAILPLVSGMRVFMYPSPIHYRIVPELCYDTNATILFGTDTFLSNYAKYSHPYNFYSLRSVFAGAEKLRDETRQIWISKFGIRIMEGYGTTEASPVVSVNTRMQYKSGSVGRLLPCMKYQFEPVEGISDGAKLFIAGPNVMLGYLLPSHPGTIKAPPHGWHDTGDIVSVDDEGYLFIKGRIKRFAKIAGEMISLTAVEEDVYKLSPEHQHAITSVDDDKKGEMIVLVTNDLTLKQTDLIAYFKKQDRAEISIPRKILYVDEIPVLGSGKTNYVAVKELVIERCRVD